MRWGEGLLWGSGQLWGGTPVQDSRGRVSGLSLVVPRIPSRGRVSGLEFETPEAVRGRVSGLALFVPERSRGRISGLAVVVPLPPARGRVSGLALLVPSTDRRGRISGLELLIPSSATRGRISGLQLVVPSFDRFGRVSALSMLVPSPEPGTGGPLPDTPDNPGGFDPDTGTPVLVEFNRHGIGVQFASSPDSPRGKVSWAHTGGVQARSVASAGVQWVEQYVPLYMTDQALWAFIAYARDLEQNERIFMVQPPVPLRSAVFGSVSGTPVVSGAGQTGYNLTTAGWTGTIQAGNIVQIGGIHTIFETVSDTVSTSPVLQLNPQIRAGGEPADGAAIFLGPDVRFRAKIVAVEWPEVVAEEGAMVGLRIHFREVP